MSVHSRLNSSAILITLFESLTLSAFRKLHRPTKIIPPGEYRVQVMFSVHANLGVSVPWVIFQNESDLPYGVPFTRLRIPLEIESTLEITVDDEAVETIADFEKYFL